MLCAVEDGQVMAPDPERPGFAIPVAVDAPAWLRDIVERSALRRMPGKTESDARFDLVEAQRAITRLRAVVAAYASVRDVLVEHRDWLAEIPYLSMERPEHGPKIARLTAALAATEGT